MYLIVVSLLSRARMKLVDLLARVGERSEIQVYSILVTLLEILPVYR
jgi:hypothetical protein